MKLKSALLAATAITMSAGVAIAVDRNDAYLTQGGDYNQAAITQSGADHDAGSSSLAIRQVRNGSNPSAGIYNTLNINQSGSNNKVGLGTANANQFGSPGVSQTIGYASTTGNYHARNLIEIEQSARDNTIGSVSQDSQTHGFSAANAVGNSAKITQSGVGNTVGSVSQQRSQTTKNFATITQSGNGNVLNRVQQITNKHDGAFDTANPNANRIDATFSGNGNGVLGWSTGRGAAVSGAVSSALIQGTNQQQGTTGNRISLNISGNNNAFGVTQTGTFNATGTVLISGSSNELGVSQSGNYNTLALSAIGGNQNVIGLKQSGDSNFATINVSGDRNVGYNAFSGGFAGSLALSASLTAGLLEQSGTSNQVTLNVSGGNDNIFASRQDNSGLAGAVGNIIDATQSGDSNNAAVVQLGSNNNAGLTQSGSGNCASFSQ